MVCIQRPLWCSLTLYPDSPLSPPPEETGFLKGAGYEATSYPGSQGGWVESLGMKWGGDYKGNCVLAACVLAMLMEIQLQLGVFIPKLPS